MIEAGLISFLEAYSTFYIYKLGEFLLVQLTDFFPFTCAILVKDAYYILINIIEINIPTTISFIDAATHEGRAPAGAVALFELMWPKS